MAARSAMVDLNMGDSRNVIDERVSCIVRHGIVGHYIKVCDASFPTELLQRMSEMTTYAFTWSEDIKLAMSKANSTHFLGFTAPGGEKTNGTVDRRQVFDFVLENPAFMDELRGGTLHDYHLLIGMNQWPSPDLVGLNFRSTVEEYMSRMRDLYRRVLAHFESMLQLPKSSLTSLDTDYAQHRLKLVKYLPSERNEDATQEQGVGAHQDETGWLTFVSEVDEPGLQAYMRNGNQWLDIPIGPDSWGLNIGKAFERATCGSIHATLHRVQAPAADAPVRHSIVFFAGLPLGQTYTSLQALFSQSKVLQRLLTSDEHLSSPGYRHELEKLVVGTECSDTFGSSQLEMWRRSYSTK